MTTLALHRDSSLTGSSIETVTTSDDTPTLAATLTLEPSSVWLIEVVALVRDQGIADQCGAFGILALAYRGLDGLAVLQGAPQNMFTPITSDPLMDLELIENGASIEVWVTGLAGVPLKWDLNVWRQKAVS